MGLRKTGIRRRISTPSPILTDTGFSGCYMAWGLV